MAMQRNTGPTALVFSRQGLPVIDRNKLAPSQLVHKGGYTLAEAGDGKPQVVLIATGSEVSVALDVRDLLEAEGTGTRVVSLPCFEAFSEQDEAYRREVLPAGVPRVSIEAGATLGWERWVGEGGLTLGLDRFGASAPGSVNYHELGFTKESVIDEVRGLLSCRQSAVYNH